MIRGLLGLAIDHPILLNLLFWVIVVVGAVSFVDMPKEEFPLIASDKIVVTAGLPGAGAEDLEDSVLRSLEVALEGVVGVRRQLAEATEGRAQITLEFAPGAEAEAAEEEVRRRVDEVSNLSDNVVGPRVEVARVKLQLIHVGLTGDPRRSDVATQVASELVQVEGVKEVQILGAHERTIRVELDAARAAALAIGPREVAMALQSAGMGAPAGALAIADKDLLVRTVKGVQGIEDLQEVPLRVGPGTHLRVGDVARLREVWSEPEVTYRVNGQPAIDLYVARQDDADALRAVPRVLQRVEELRATLPEGLDLIGHDASSYLLSHRLGGLARNAALGLLGVALLLTIFVGGRNALLVFWGVPVAFLGTAAAMYGAGLSINLLSVFALLLVTGIVVDDAVVIVENVQRHLEAGKSRLEAALSGSVEVIPPVLAATLTTCLAFAPLLMLEGMVGRAMRIIPLVVVVCLLASLIEAFIILPGHLAHYGPKEAPPYAERASLAIRRFYEPLLLWVTERRRRLPVLGVMGAFLAVALVVFGGMRLTLTTPGRPVFAVFELDMVPSTSAEGTRGAVRALETLASREVPHLLRFFRAQVGQRGMPDELPIYGPRYASVALGFRNTPDLVEEVAPFLDHARALLERRLDVEGFVVRTVSGGPPVGKPIDVRVRGRDLAAVRGAVEKVVRHLEARSGVHQIEAEWGLGGDSLEVQVNEARAARAGLRVADVSQAVRYALDGATALELSVDEENTRVQVSHKTPKTKEELSNLVLRRPDGGSVRLRQVAEVLRVRSLERISRVNGARAVRVVAELDPEETETSREREALELALAANRDVELLWGGEAQDTAESFRRLPTAAALAVLLIYAVLAVQFGSYLQPLLILAAVPLGVAGAVLGLFCFGMELSLVAGIGAVGLTGIVVNDSLVLVDFINHRRRKGATIRDAVLDASRLRLRPILITTVTTVAGLFPLAVGLGGREPLLAPMAVAISVGLVFATAMTLVVVPVLYLVLEDRG